MKTNQAIRVIILVFTLIMGVILMTSDSIVIILIGAAITVLSAVWLLYPKQTKKD